MNNIANTNTSSYLIFNIREFNVTEAKYIYIDIYLYE